MGRKVPAKRKPRRAVEVRQGHATRQFDEVATDARISEMTMMGLRLAEGIPLSRFEAETGRPFIECFEPARLRRLGEGSFLEVEEGRLRATAAGRQCLNAVLGELLG